MELGLKGKVAIVTGGSRGIGRAIATGLAEEGVSVAISARDQTQLDQTVEEIRASGAQIIGVAGDATIPADIERLVAETVAAFGAVDILINNVGGNRGGKFMDATDEDFAYTFDLNFMAAIRASRLVIPEMRKRGGGRIITISSIWGREAGGVTTYNAAKAAEISMGKQLARELAPENILVNTIAPGSTIFPGGGWDRQMKANPEAMADLIKRDLPLGRFGKPEEVANVVVFLASERASLVTGTCYNVDGGQSRSNI